ncbi:hypothetical protein Tco_1026609 [Tanacetum coccineum]
MHNDIMAAGSKDRPPMLATGRYAQWKSCFMRYVDTKPNMKELKKCIFNGPYVMTRFLVPAKPTTKINLAVPEHTVPETFENTLPENHAYTDAEVESIHMIMSGIEDQIFSIYPSDNYYHAPKPHKNQTTSSRHTSSTSSHALTRTKDKEIAKPRTPPSLSASKEDSDPEQAQGDKDMQKCIALIAKEVRSLTLQQPEKNEVVPAKEAKIDKIALALYREVHSKICVDKSNIKVLTKNVDDNDEDECFELANLIANLKLDIDENKKIQKQLRKPNATLTYELNESKSALTESNDIRNRCRSSLHQKEVPYDKDDLANKFEPNCKETLFEDKSRSNLNEDKKKSGMKNVLKLKLIKQKDTFSKEEYKTVKSFFTLEQHLISLDLALQQCKEQLKNDKVWKQQESTLFQEINQKYFEIQDLKAQLQDRDIEISELKKLIEKSNGKSVETKVDKPPVVRQTNAI